jgi:hypothetical protein
MDPRAFASLNFGLAGGICLMTIRIEFPFTAQFEAGDFISNSRELRTQFLQTYLLNSGMELGNAPENFEVTSFQGDDNGEFWTVEVGK